MSTPQIMEPSACTWCGIAERGHGRQYADAAGWHAWAQPSQEQMLARMKARRLQLAVARAGALPMPVGGVRTLDVVEEELTGVNLALWEEVQAYARLRLALTAAKRDRSRLRAQVAELLEERHSTNEALSDAAEALRADREGPALPWAASMDDGDLSMFLDDMVSAAMGRWRSEPEVPDRTVLADIEKVCANWRTPGQGLRGDLPDAATLPVPARAVCRCDEPGADPYACEAEPEDCSGEFSELNPFGGGPVHGHDAKVSRPCGQCEFRTSLWHVDDGSAEEELHRHVVGAHGGGA